jgi:hypothetical protein
MKTRTYATHIPHEAECPTIPEKFAFPSEIRYFATRCAAMLCAAGFSILVKIRHNRFKNFLNSMLYNVSPIVRKDLEQITS